MRCLPKYAKERLCPIMTAGGEGEAVGCVADDCMAWNWTMSDRGEAEETGFCGLASIPLACSVKVRKYEP